MLTLMPPPVFRYDVGNFEDLVRKSRRLADAEHLPELEVREVVIEMDVCGRLPQVMARCGKPSGNVLVVMDGTDMYRQGELLKPRVLAVLGEAGYAVRQVVLQGDEYGLVHADFEQVRRVMQSLAPDTAVVSVGTGTVTDVAKHACFLYAQEEGVAALALVALMTACSAPAYTSQSSIIGKDGVKRTWPSRTPDVILEDLQTLMDAPGDMTLGGVGDTFPVFSAFADWYLAETFGFSGIVDAAWRMYDDVRELLLPYMPEIAAHSAVGMEVLSKCIHNVGLAMTYARDTAAASGFDHGVSHMLDMTAEYDKRKQGIHGQQVGLAVVVTLLHMEKLIERMDQVYSGALPLDVKSCKRDMGLEKEAVRRVFGPIGEGQAGECWRDYSKKLDVWNQNCGRLAQFVENWPEHKANLQRFAPYSALQCAEALDIVSHPLLFEELAEPVSPQRGRWAVAHANQMRERFTSADLACFLGWMDEEWVEDIFRRLGAVVGRLRQPGRDAQK